MASTFTCLWTASTLLDNLLDALLSQDLKASQSAFLAISIMAANLTALQLHVAFWDYNNDSYARRPLLRPVFTTPSNPHF